MKIVLTGASSGIGREAAKFFAARGDAVYVMARRADRLAELAGELKSIAVFSGDVSSRGDVDSFRDFTGRDGIPVDAVVNCAGSFGAIGPCASIDPEEWWHTLRVNLFGTLIVMQAFIPSLEKAPSPRIINFSGGGAFQAFPNYSAYAVSKAGTVRLTENAAAELKPRGISVNALAPGFVATEIHEATIRAGKSMSGAEHFENTKKKLAEGAVPIDVPVACLAYLLSEKAAGLTGKTISASFDPWRDDQFSMMIEEINKSDLFTMQRINLSHLGIKGIGQLKAPCT